MTKDERVSVTLPSDASRIISVARGGDGVYVAVAGTSVGTGAGQWTLTASFGTVTLSAKLTLYGSTGIKMSLTPFPVYPRSDSVGVDTLSLIGCSDPTRYQESHATVSMSFSADVSSTDVTGSAVMQLAVFRRGTSTASNWAVVRKSGSRNVVSVTTAGMSTAPDDVSVDIEATCGAAVDRFTLNIDHSPVSVTSVDNVKLDSGSTLHGIAGKASTLTRCGVTFSDGRRIPELFTGSAPTLELPGCICFRSTVTSAVADDPVIGRATLLGNHHSEISIKAEICAQSPPISGFVTTAANLDPAFGDMDVGSKLGVPLPSRSVGDIFPVEIRSNTAGVRLRVAKVLLHYDPFGLQFHNPRSTAGSSKNQGVQPLYTGGSLNFLDHALKKPPEQQPGTLEITMVVGGNGSPDELCEVYFKAVIQRTHSRLQVRS